MSKLYYYVQERGFVGDCALWWGKNRRGYVTDLSEAGLYTEEEVRQMRKTDVGWPQELVERCVVRHVRVETLRLLASSDAPIKGKWG